MTDGLARVEVSPIEPVSFSATSGCEATALSLRPFPCLRSLRRWDREPQPSATVNAHRKFSGVRRGAQPMCAGGAVVHETRECNEHAPARHRARVVITALDLVPRVALARMVAFVDGSADRESLLERVVGNDVRRDLILDACPYLVPVARRARAQVFALRPRARCTGTSRLLQDERTSVPVYGVRSEAKRPAPVVTPDGAQCRAHSLRGLLDAVEDSQ